MQPDLTRLTQGLAILTRKAMAERMAPEIGAPAAVDALETIVPRAR